MVVIDVLDRGGLTAVQAEGPGDFLGGPCNGVASAELSNGAVFPTHPVPLEQQVCQAEDLDANEEEAQATGHRGAAAAPAALSASALHPYGAHAGHTLGFRP